MDANDLLRAASAELRRLSVASNEDDVARSVRALKDYLEPALEAEHPTYGKATRAIRRWMVSQRLERRRRRERPSYQSTPLAAV